MTGITGAPFFVTMVTGRSPARAAAGFALAAALVSWPVSGHAQARCRANEVAVTPPDAQIRVGATYPFVATAYDRSGIPCDDVTFAWQSSAPGVVTIDANGIATGVSPGSATITARTGVGTAARGGRSAITVVSSGAVTSQAVTIPGFSRVLNRPTGQGYAAFDRQPEGTGPADGGLYVDPLRLTLVRGESRILDYRAVRADGGNAARVPIVFTVDAGGERIVAVDSLGHITSLGDTGTATVRAVVPTNQRIQPKTVRVEVRGDSVRFNRTVLSLTPGTVETLSVFVPAQSRALDPSGLFQFGTSDTARVKVNPVQPIVEAVAPGTARVTAQSSIYPDISVTVHVHRRVARLELTPADSQLTLAIGGTVTLRARAIGVDGAPVAEAPVTWTVPDTVVSYDRATGALRGRHTGSVILSVQAPTGRDSATTRFIRVRVVAGGLAVARPRLSMSVGQRVPIEATILDERRQPVGSANELLAWRTSADSVARVEGNQVIAVRPGLAQLTGLAPWDSTVTIAVAVAGDLVVAAQQGGRWDLQMVWENGSRFAPLTADSLIEAQAAWSRDYGRIAFTAAGTGPSRTPTSSLWVMNADGTGRLRLTDDSAQIEWPRWTPDGSRIVYESNRTGRPQIWMHEFGPDGAVGTNRQVTTLTPGAPNTAPAVSPDGSRIAYVSLRESSPGRRGYVILHANLEGTDERMLTGGGLIDEPLYAPDGRSLYFLRAENNRGQQSKRVFRLPLGGAATDTAVAVTPPSLFVQQFSISADGQSLALTLLEPAQGGGTTSRVVLFRLASGEVTALGLPREVRLSSPVLRPPPPAAPARP